MRTGYFEETTIDTARMPVRFGEAYGQAGKSGGDGRRVAISEPCRS